MHFQPAAAPAAGDGAVARSILPRRNLNAIPTRFS